MNNTDKHAYCIMAHDNWEQLQMLIGVLDDERNDIFLHIDVKSLDKYRRCEVKVTRSKLYYAKSVDVRWSDVSLADAEVNLFNKVLSTGVRYQRIHLISGADLPLVSQEMMHRFFNNRNDEFIDVRQPSQFIKRLKYYHFFVKYRRNKLLIDFLRRLLLIPQLPFINRLRHSPLPYAYGSEWCSLTYKGIEAIAGTYADYRHMFKYTTCCDEHYKQMILMAKGFVFAKEGCMRYVLFTSDNPSPKVLTMDDFDTMQASGCLFARKFDIHIDENVVDKVIFSIKDNHITA